jgi:hypothetical protein
MRRSACTALMAFALLAPCAAPADADELIANVARPTPVGALGGRVVWSDYDALQGAYFLTQRFNGITARLPVRPRSVPFDVDLGLDSGGTVVAAYSRCRQEPGGRNQALATSLTLMPQWSTGRGCDAYALNPGTGVETRVAGASSAGASEFLPSVSRSRIAFARVYERRPGRAGKRAYLFVRSLTRRGTSRRVPAGPRSRGRLCAFRPPPCRRVIEPGPTGLDLSRRALGFGWDSAGREGISSEVYLERLRAGRIARLRVARGSSGDMQHREFMAPQIDGQNLAWILSLAGDLTLGEVGRYTIAGGKRRVAPLRPDAGEPVLRSVISGAVDGSTAFYVASALVPLDELPCTLQSFCVAEPGCSDAQPCPLRAAPGLKFTRPTRR